MKKSTNNLIRKAEEEALTPYAVSIRYGLDDEFYSSADAGEAYEKAMIIITLLRKKIKESK